MALICQAKLKSIAQMVQALKDVGPEAINGFKVLLKQILDQSKMTPEQAYQYAHELIYEHQSSDHAKSAQNLVESGRIGGDTASHEGSGSPTKN